MIDYFVMQNDDKLVYVVEKDGEAYARDAKPLDDAMLPRIYDLPSKQYMPLNLYLRLRLDRMDKEAVDIIKDFNKYNWKHQQIAGNEIGDGEKNMPKSVYDIMKDNKIICIEVDKINIKD